MSQLAEMEEHHLNRHRPEDEDALRLGETDDRLLLPNAWRESLSIGFRLQHPADHKRAAA
ncbi:hypothetical protein [Rhizobium leguminosarum]|uniref:hypothetical protein n=1 Tax=Rhizobium leguminosarum TaxID=384 RepID=UPI00041A2ED1